jgi:hypothetical protein
MQEGMVFEVLIMESYRLRKAFSTSKLHRRARSEFREVFVVMGGIELKKLVMEPGR